MEDFIARSTQFIREQLHLRGFQNVVLGLSGGIDSAVVAYLATHALGSNHVHALLMPSLSSSQDHFDDALCLAQILNINTKIIRLAPFQENYAREEGLDISGAFMNRLDHEQKLRMGNFCARMRMIWLYDYAASQKALVLGTSNKSELMLGYGTIFGDLASALNPIGALFKTQIFTLARALGVPDSIIAKKPSADLWSYQNDEIDLGYSYDRIDIFLAHFEKLGGLEMKSCEKNMPSWHAHIRTKLAEAGFESDMIESLCTRIWRNTFKRELPLVFMYHHKGDKDALY